MIILGIHKDPWHNTGAAIIKEVDNEVQFAFISEERLNREKDSRVFPIKSILACMKQLNINSKDEIDLIVMDHIEDIDWRKDNKTREVIVNDFFKDINEEKIKIINHHLAHACSTFFSSSFDEAAVLIVDGRGTMKETQSLFYASTKDNQINLLDSTDKVGIGLLYSTVSQKIGFGKMQEGKTMGLAPYGRDNNKRIFNFPKEFVGVVTDYSNVVSEGTYTLTAEYDKEISGWDDVATAAYEVQEECEAAFLHLAKYAKEKTKSDFLCLSGGVALNSVSNDKVLKSGLFNDIFINPACSDTGIPLGCALYGYHIAKGRPKSYSTINPYMGPEYSVEDINKAISSFTGFSIYERNAIEKLTEMLIDNKIIARHYGRSEMGPRALGNRSILMNPTIEENKDVLNERVKHRESFRPFAPAILEEFTCDYFDLDRQSPYMLLVPNVNEDKRQVIPAVTHVDGTARVQTLTKERNGAFYDLVESFYKISGVPVLLNTSFNVAGEPIVETPEDAIRCFLSTNIDALLIGEILLIK
ncbi:carbamoyl transferase [Paenibacillus sp. LMG 31461]|uniref:Carbamoyl transferase n=1 Tax=Paenibacillus plantarum TaxID=2654975 RepID=A0ABX1XFR4_9BACL|nr:carbamoyltransferase C-terminal domain-containing protein [Paenibacillus plantarum]NOU66740.1 carbamoyl transferase [Paenibacillus plantarum]